MPTRFTSLLVLLAALALPRFVLAQDADAAKDQAAATEDKLPAGHSAHGEAFDAGPRQKAYLMGTTGKIHFPATTTNELAQKFIEQGVGQLHGFWYFEAERSFRQAAALDPDCAIAYWGMAQANTNNSKRAKAFIEEANKRKDKASRREQLYIDALYQYYTKTKDEKDRQRKYVDGLETIIHEFPDDLDARAFLALHLWHSSRTLGLPSHEAVSSILELIFQKEPMHPAHHYRIHLWDTKKPERALASAALCGQSAPGIAHMWHMPGHIYSRLKRYEDAVFQQEASSRVDHAHMIRDHVLPTEIHNYAHNQEWCIRNLIYIGRIRDAMNLAKNLVELPRHPKHNVPSQRGSAANYGRTRLFQVLTTYHLWDEFVKLQDSVYLDVADSETDQIKKIRYLGVAHAALGHADEAAAQVAELERRQADLKTKQDKAAADAVAKADESKNANDKQRKKAEDDARRPFNVRLRAIELALHHIHGAQASAAADFKQALEEYKQASDLQKCDLALAYLKAGDTNKAEQLAREDVDRSKNECYPLACYVEVLHEAGKHKDAKQRFEDLRKISSGIDTDLSVFARLRPIAVEYGYEENWQRAPETKPDVGVRPPLDSLGPFRWSPPSAESWSLTDAHGKPISSHDFDGKPTVLIFYLGFGCLHCVEQLQSFAPMTKDFQDAGIQLVAIGTDSLPDLKQALTAFEDEKKFPFRLAADPEMKIFKQYRCFDDFENVPLHGTFLIDGAGRVRWQDISYDPFTKPKFLLDEAKRLLAQPSP